MALFLLALIFGYRSYRSEAKLGGEREKRKAAEKRAEAIEEVAVSSGMARLSLDDSVRMLLEDADRADRG